MKTVYLLLMPKTEGGSAQGPVMSQTWVKIFCYIITKYIKKQLFNFLKFQFPLWEKIKELNQLGILWL